jgi:hypothetical protein
MAADEKPVLIAYDGSDHAKQAIEQAGAELRMPRKAVVVAAYQPLEALPFWGRPAGIVPDELIEEAGKEAAKTAARVPSWRTRRGSTPVLRSAKRTAPGKPSSPPPRRPVPGSSFSGRTGADLSARPSWGASRPPLHTMPISP